MTQLEWQETFYMDIRRAVGVLGCTWEEINDYIDRGLIRLSNLPPHRRRRVAYTEDIKAIADKLEHERYGVPIVNLPPRTGVPNVLLRTPAIRPPRLLPVPMMPIKAFFVYILRLPNGNPFYVGKGTRDRPYEHITEAQRGDCRCRKCQVIQLIHKMGKEVLITYEFETNKSSEALKRESALIQELYHDYHLTNRNGNYYYDRNLPLPRPLRLMSSGEWSAYLDRMPLLTKKERDQLSIEWRECRIEHLEDLWRTARRQHWHEREAEVSAELEPLLAQIGHVVQRELPLEYNPRRKRR